MMPGRSKFGTQLGEFDAAALAHYPHDVLHLPRDREALSRTIVRFSGFDAPQRREQGAREFGRHDAIFLNDVRCRIARLAVKVRLGVVLARCEAPRRRPYRSSTRSGAAVVVPRLLRPTPHLRSTKAVGIGGEQRFRLEEHQGRRDDEVFGRDLDVERVHHRDVIEILLGHGREGHGRNIERSRSRTRRQ